MQIASYVGIGAVKVEIERSRDRVDSFLTELTYELYQAQAGLKDEAKVGHIYDRYSDLFDLDSFMRLSQPWEGEQEGEKSKSRRFLREFAGLGYLDYQGRDLEERILNEEARATVVDPVQGRISFRLSFVKLRDQANRHYREDLAREQLAVMVRLESLFAEREDRFAEGAGCLGFPSYPSAIESMSPVDLEELRQAAKKFLEQTADIYRENLSWFLGKRLQLKLGQAKKHDLDFLFRSQEFDQFFHKHDLLPRVENFVSQMGFSLTGEGRIHFDLEPRPLKTARAFCAPVRVPGEIYLTVLPTGGYQFYRDFLHELGHALHYAYLDEELPVEFRRLGDASVTEAFAFVFDHIMLEPVGLAIGFKTKAQPDMVRFFQLGQLCLLRRYFGKLIYEWELRSNVELKGKDILYQDILTEATLVTYPKESYLYDIDPHFYTARYLRAWMLEAALYYYLRDNYDQDWFRCPEAGDFLRLLFREGQRFTGEEIAQRLGSQLDLALLVQRACHFL